MVLTFLVCCIASYIQYEAQSSLKFDVTFYGFFCLWICAGLTICLLAISTLVTSSAPGFIDKRHDFTTKTKSLNFIKKKTFTQVIISYGGYFVL